MLRDRNCERNFERSLMYEISRLKIAVRKLHNDMVTGFTNPRADKSFTDAMRALIALAYEDD